HFHRPVQSAVPDRFSEFRRQRFPYKYILGERDHFFHTNKRSGTLKPVAARLWFNGARGRVEKGGAERVRRIPDERGEGGRTRDVQIVKRDAIDLRKVRFSGRYVIVVFN